MFIVYLYIAYICIAGHCSQTKFSATKTACTQQYTSALHHPPSFFLAWLTFQPKCNPSTIPPQSIPPLSPGLSCASLLSANFLNLFSAITHAKLHQMSIYKLVPPLKDTDSDLSVPLSLISSTRIWWLFKQRFWIIESQWDIQHYSKNSINIYKLYFNTINALICKWHHIWFHQRSHSEKWSIIVGIYIHVTAFPMLSGRRCLSESWTLAEASFMTVFWNKPKSLL